MTPPTTPDEDQLCAALDPQTILASVAAVASDVLPADRIGVAADTPARDACRVHGLWDRHGRELDTGYTFDWKDAAGGWVREHNRPIVGHEPDDMKRYERTFAYLENEDFASNLIAPIDLGPFGRGVVFMLARESGAFAHDALAAALRIRDVLEPALRAHFAARELIFGREIDARPDADDRPAVVDDRLPTLREMERAHIERALRRAGGVVEGPRGAAHMLGLHPSTLRHRMRKHGVKRDGARDA